MIRCLRGLLYCAPTFVIWWHLLWNKQSQQIQLYPCRLYLFHLLSSGKEDRQSSVLKNLFTQTLKASFRHHKSEFTFVNIYIMTTIRVHQLHHSATIMPLTILWNDLQLKRHEISLITDMGIIIYKDVFYLAMLPYFWAH